MKKWILAGLFSAVCAFCILGCQQQEKKESKKVSLKEPLLLTVDFEPNQSLVYDFVSERVMNINLDPSGKYSKGKQDGRQQSQTEKLEMQITYKPVNVNPLGVSVVEAVCNSAKVIRSGGTSRAQSQSDAVESLVGKSFTLKIDPTGKIVDYSSLEQVAQQLGDKAFSGSDGKRGRVKNPDMIMDFLATQWNIWDAVATIKEPSKGITPQSEWHSTLIAPMPYVSKVGRKVEYGLAGIEKTNDGAVARIVGNIGLSEKPVDVVMPYSGSFQMKGMFGFLQGYKVLSIEGESVQLFNVDKGLIVSDKHNYKAEVKASIFGLGSDELTPNIIIDQTTSMTLVK